MSMEQIRAQRAYLDASDLEREAGERIEVLQVELVRWRNIREQAQALGSEALAEVIKEPETKSVPTINKP